ncbi:hypothetical protein AB4F11_01050 [Francisella philomiragia]
MALAEDLGSVGVVLKNKVIPAKAGISKAWMILKRFPPAWE